MFCDFRRQEQRDMKHKLNLIPAILIFGALASTSFAATTRVQGDAEKMDLSILGNLIKNNEKGDWKYPGGYKFTRSGSRAYINHFARKLAQNDSEIATYEDVISQGIRVFEEQEGPKGYTNDLAGGMAFYTMVNVGLATNKPYEDNFFGNMVAQFRKAFSSKIVSSMSAAKKQDMYDYMITESVYMQALASAGQERSKSDTAEFLIKMGNMQIQNTFHYDASKMTIDASGVHFN
jgi:hypothetical protein